MIKLYIYNFGKLYIFIIDESGLKIYDISCPEIAMIKSNLEKAVFIQLIKMSTSCA